MSDKLTAETLRACAVRLANIRQGRSSTPRCEPPGEYEIERAMRDVKDVLDSPAILAMAEGHARMRDDAARYHWLRDHSCPPHNFYISVPDEFAGERYGPSEVDAYIDEARRALGKDQADG